MKICVLGATGLVGRELSALIPARWPGAALELYASSARELVFAGEPRPVWAASALDEPDRTGGDLAFVALDDEHSKRYVPRLRALGYRVVDKSNAFRLDPAVPLVVAGVNDGLVDAEVGLVANPNCTTIPLCIALAALGRAGHEPVELTVSTYQAISGAGSASLERFIADWREGLAALDEIGLSFDREGYAANVFPHQGGTDDSGFSSEERKLMAETRKILERPGLAIGAQCCRVPVLVGHYLNVWLELARPAGVRELEAALEAHPLIRLQPGPWGDGLTSLEAVHERDLVLAGRIRADPRPPEGRRFCLTVVADNLRLGAATNAVRIAERWFPPAA